MTGKKPAKDVDTETKLLAALERASKAYEIARGAAGIAEEVRKHRGERIQSIREQKARARASAAYSEIYRAEQALKEFREKGTAKGKDGLIFSALKGAAVLMALLYLSRIPQQPVEYDLTKYVPPRREW